MQMLIMASQAVKQMGCQEEGRRTENEHTESVKASKVTIQRPGAGNLGIDGCNCVRRAADEWRTSVNGSDTTRRQGDVLPTDGDP